MEFLPACLSIIEGKAKKLDCLYMVRQINSPKSYVGLSNFDWISNPSWGEEYILFSKILSEQIVFKSNEELDLAKKTVSNAFWLFLTKVFHEEELTQISETMRTNTPTIRKKISRFLTRMYPQSLSKIKKIIINKNHLYKLKRKYHSNLSSIINVVECEKMFFPK